MFVNETTEKFSMKFGKIFRTYIFISTSRTAGFGQTLDHLKIYFINIIFHLKINFKVNFLQICVLPICLTFVTSVCASQQPY